MLNRERGGIAAPGADTARAADGERRRGPGRWRAARPRLAWAGALVVAALVLFWCYLRQSQTTGVNADGAGMALQGWEMVHGNLLLSGWLLADVTFYTFEVPIDGLVAVAHGLNSDVVHITAAIVYTLLVLTAALLARGAARGAEGVLRAVLAAGILVAPGYNPGTHILLLSPDHTGIAVPVMLTLLFMDRMPERWWVPAGVCLLLTWAQVDDPLATYAAALPIALVCLVRAGLPLLLRGRPGWYDAGLAAGAALSVELARLAVAGIRAAGGYTMQSFSSGHEQKIGKIVPFSVWGTQIRATVENVLILFGADFYEQPTGIRTAIALAHFAGLALAVAGLLAGIVCLFRGADRITQILTVGTLVTLVGGAIATQMLVLQGAHEIAVVLPFGAVLAGRTIGPWLAARRLPRITLTPVLAAALACYLAALGYGVSQPARPAETQSLADWLVAHDLTSGLARYWAASSTTLSGGGQVRVIPVTGFGKVPYTWVAKSTWYDPAASRANFVVAMPGRTGNAYAFPEAGIRGSFGKPAREYRVGQYIIMVYDYNLLSRVRQPTAGRP